MSSTNLAKIRRERMLKTINEIKNKTTDEETLNNLSLIENELTKKKYGLIWEEHEERVDKELETQIPTFEDVKEKEIVSNQESDYNFLLEGDNLHSLYLLQKTHTNRIDLIYIDPPYNTGNKDFVYSDDTVDLEDGFRHSKWLSFMARRLKIARDLLSDRGVIFISIDDNEQSQLKLLCDDIFGEEHFLGLITVVGNPRGRDYGGIAKMNDYLLVYSKTGKYVLNKIEDKEHVFKMKDELGGFELRELRNRNIKFNDKNRPNLCYPFYVNPNSKDEHGLLEISLENKDGYIEVMPAMSQGIQTVWRWGKEKSLKNLNINIKGKAMKEKGRYMIVEKYRDEKVMPRSVWWDKDTNTEKGTLLLKEILGDKSFDYPKPVELIKRICEMSTDKDSIILDFFAGSGTTGQAVMSLNNSDGGNRKYILCTNNENNICENVTYRRLYNIINGYKNSKNEIVKEYENINLKYYRCTNIPKINNDNENLHLNLLKDIKNIIQLENGISVDDIKIQVYLDEDSFDKFTENDELLDNCNKVYISSDILLTSSQERKLQDNNIDLYIIPEYYFDEEIMEVA